MEEHPLQSLPFVNYHDCITMRHGSLQLPESNLIPGRAAEAAQLPVYLGAAGGLIWDSLNPIWQCKNQIIIRAANSCDESPFTCDYTLYHALENE